jgi:hypothetical protein
LAGHPHSQVKARDLLVQVLGQGIDLVLVGGLVGPQLDLGQGLVGEADADITNEG